LDKTRARSFSRIRLTTVLGFSAVNNTAVLSIFLPAALAVIMLGLGLSLSVADFRRVLTYPKAVTVALGCQLLLLPLVCVGISHLYGLAPALAVGMMLLAASPGGTAANLYSHLARGDVALNITLTAINSVLAIVTLPLVLNLSLWHFLGEGQTIPLQFGKVAQVFAVVLVPVAIGMGLRHHWPAFAGKMDKPVKRLSLVFLLVVIGIAVAGNWQMLPVYVAQVGLAALTFNLVSLAIGYGLPRLVNLDRRQATAIGMEVGIHNGTLAIAIAMSPQLLGNPTMAIPAAIYGLIAFVTAALFGLLVSRRGDTISPSPHLA
jgi:bile acid:Na+ symporter, BASS family